MAPPLPSSASLAPSPPSIAGLWLLLYANPVAIAPWHGLVEAYAAAGLAPQWAYAVAQVQRLQRTQQPSHTLSPLAAAPGSADPSPAQADTWLLHPHHHDAQRWAQALEAWLESCPGDWLSWLYLARLRDGDPAAFPSADAQRREARSRQAQNSTSQRRPGAATAAAAAQLNQRAQDALRQAEALEAVAGESRHWLGLWRLNGGDPAAAVQALTPLVDRQPPRYGSLLQLGLALLRLGHRPAAEAAFTRASASSNPGFLRLLAQRVYEHNYWQEAIAVLQRALELAPHDLDTLVALARLHWEVYNLSAAEALCRRVLALDPSNSEVPYLLHALPGRRGDAAAQLEAVEAHYTELADPGSRLASSIAMASLYVDALKPEQVAQRHRELCAPIEAACSPHPLEAFPNGRDPDRPLRLGLVSGDFHRQHPVNLFMLPLLERLDPQHYSVAVFHTGSMHDEYTARARRAAADWIEAANLHDQALQRRILAAGIDVLIDLAGHTSSHRLGVFALRAAPVQATFLGYPHSTGLSRIDWLIGDPQVSPAEHAHLFSEGIAQLPGSVFCWSPVDPYPLPPPRPAEEPLVFGSFNNIMKLSPTTIRLWAALLRELPEARLLLKAPSLADGSVVERFTTLFATEGVSPERLVFEGPSELSQMMQRYGAIDIALDPIPYNGGTTTLQALWMGVPVISLRGGNFVSRMGASFLTALGQADWIADDENQYRLIAHQLADQLPAIRQDRAALRTRMAGSGLADLDRYASHFQALLRRMWQVHAGKANCRLLLAQAGDPVSRSSDR